MDEKYLKNSNDNTYNVDQRIVILKNDITNLINILEKLTNSIDNSLFKLNRNMLIQEN